MQMENLNHTNDENNLRNVVEEKSEQQDSIHSLGLRNQRITPLLRQKSSNYSIAALELQYRIDIWLTTIEKIFEFLHSFVTFFISRSMFVLAVSTTCAYLAICCIISLQIVIIFTDYSGLSYTRLLMIFIVLFTWTYGSTIIVSRQVEILLLISETPFSFDRLKLSQLIAKETNPLRHPYFRLTTQALTRVPYPKFPTLTIVGVMVLFFGCITVALFAVGIMKSAFFFFLLFIISITFIAIWIRPRELIKDKLPTRPQSSIVSWSFLAMWLFGAICGLVTAGMSLCDIGLDNVYLGSTGFAVITLGFITSSIVLSLVHVGRDAWYKPIYYIWVEAGASPYIVGKVLITLMFAAFVVFIAAFILFMQNTSDFWERNRNLCIAAESIFMSINLTSCLVAIYVYMKPSKNVDLNKANAMIDVLYSDDVEPMMMDILYSESVETDSYYEREGGASGQVVEIQAKATGTLEKNGNLWNRIYNTILSKFSISSEWIMANLVFLLFLLFGLTINQPDGMTWFLSILYFVLTSVLLLALDLEISVGNIKQRHNNDINNWKAMQGMCMLTIIILVVILVPTSSIGLPSIFVITIFSHGFMILLFNLLLSSPYTAVSQQTIDLNMKLYFGYDTPIAEYCPVIVSKYKNRRFSLIYAILVVANAIGLFLFTWATISTHFDSISTTPSIVNSLEITASAIPQYGICASDTYSLNVIDVNYLVQMAYLRLPTDPKIDCGFTKPSNLITCLNFYFSNNYTKPALHNKPYNWELIDISVPKDSNSVIKSSFYSIKSTNANLIVIAVRGSVTGRDWLENFNLYVQITMLKIFSFIVPFTTIWPTAVTQTVVKVLSFSETLTLTNSYAGYYEPVVKYVNTLKKQYPTYNIAIMGHSLGGAISSIVGARTGTRSFNFESPGTVFTAIKFNIPSFSTTISQSEIVTIRYNDPLTYVDKQVSCSICIDSVDVALKCHSNLYYLLFLLIHRVGTCKC